MGNVKKLHDYNGNFVCSSNGTLKYSKVFDYFQAVFGYLERLSRSYPSNISVNEYPKWVNVCR